MALVRADPRSSSSWNLLVLKGGRRDGNSSCAVRTCPCLTSTTQIAGGGQVSVKLAAPPIRNSFYRPIAVLANPLANQPDHRQTTAHCRSAPPQPRPASVCRPPRGCSLLPMFPQTLHWPQSRIFLRASLPTARSSGTHQPDLQQPLIMLIAARHLLLPQRFL